MTLKDGIIGKTYVVKNINLEIHIMRRLEAIGLNDGTKVAVVNRKTNGTMIIKTRGTRWAVGRALTAGITVDEVAYEQANK
ncbi:MAG: FeoA family protein [Lachnospiraceae bacterium]